jgi:myo-inositol 2-dehydrogenase/D-chiro-inositol 1-dehydrogenase
MARIGVVGAGRMGRVHIQAVHASGEVDLAAIVEPHAPSREAVSSYGAPVYETPEDLLSAGGLDGVLVAAPSDRHPDLVALFAGAGLPLLCEKPLGVTVSDGEQATEAAARHDVLLQVGYWRRFVPALRELRARIQGDELGEINQLACMQWDAQPPSEQFRASSGGIAVDMGVHEFDQVRWLLGQEIGWLAAVPAGSTTGDRRHRRIPTPPRSSPSCPAARVRRSHWAGASPTRTPAGSRCGAQRDTGAFRSCGTPTASGCSSRR